jgi:hypothetical protein
MAKSETTAPAKTAMVTPAPLVADPGSELKGEKNIPQIEGSPLDLPGAASRPPVSEFSGTYTKIDDKEDYALAVVEDDPMGRTHKALNSLHYWEGTREQFRAAFDVSDNDKRAPKDDSK